MQLLVISDIHGNLTALEAVLGDARSRFEPDALALLGDVVDYGPRPNECIAALRAAGLPAACGLWGNHERAVVLRDWSGFSTARGAASARRTRGLLTPESLEWLEGLPGRGGRQEFEWGGMRVLAVHGSAGDPYWRAIAPGDDAAPYEPYDLVLSGHSHLQQSWPAVHRASADRREWTRTLFVNPGSVGQPRDLDPRAHYAVVDTEAGVALAAVPYDVAREQALYGGEVDDFYRERLGYGF